MIEQQPATHFWGDVGRLIQAASRASAHGHLSGTTNWAAAVIAQMGPMPAIDPVHEYRKGFIAGQIDMRNRSEEQWVGLTEEDKLRLLPTVQLKDEDPKPQVWLTRKDAFAYVDAAVELLREKNSG